MRENFKSLSVLGDGKGEGLMGKGGHGNNRALKLHRWCAVGVVVWRCSDQTGPGLILAGGVTVELNLAGVETQEGSSDVMIVGGRGATQAHNLSKYR